MARSGPEDFSESLTSSIVESCSALADGFGVVRSSRRMLRMVDYARGIAPTRYPVLIAGEEGTGKERFARGIHDLSQRSGPFVPVDCGSIPEDSFEAEFFGCTGTPEEGPKAGLVRAADGGTLFVHGVGHMPKLSQVKFLRLLRDGDMLARGGTAYEHVNVRVVATTNEELDDLVEQGQFNRSLLLELSAACIRLPALREREDDLFVLFSAALESAAGGLGHPVPEVDPQVYQLIREYSWPENIRELNSTVLSAMMRAKGRPLKARHFSALQERIEKKAPSPPEPRSKVIFDPSLDQMRPLFVELQECERAYLELLLKKCDNNLSKAAEIAAVTRTTVREKARQYGLRDSPDGGDHTERSLKRLRKP